MFDAALGEPCLEALQRFLEQVRHVDRFHVVGRRAVGDAGVAEHVVDQPPEPLALGDDHAGAFVPEQTVAGLFNLQGLVLFGLYVSGIVSAVLVSLVAKWLHRTATEHPLMLELPSYRMPHVRDVLLGLLERGQIFVRRVGTIILALTVLLWGLSEHIQCTGCHRFPCPPIFAMVLECFSVSLWQLLA